MALSRRPLSADTSNTSKPLTVVWSCQSLEKTAGAFFQLQFAFQSLHYAVLHNLSWKPAPLGQSVHQGCDVDFASVIDLARLIKAFPKQILAEETDIQAVDIWSKCGPHRKTPCVRGPAAPHVLAWEAILRSIRVAAPLMKVVQSILARLPPNFVSVHPRVEKDWQRFVFCGLKNKATSEQLSQCQTNKTLAPATWKNVSQIADMLRKHKFGSKAALYVAGGAAVDPEWHSIGFDMVIDKNISRLTEDVSPLLEGALVDWEVCKHATVHIGHAHSSWDVFLHHWRHVHGKPSLTYINSESSITRKANAASELIRMTNMRDDNFLGIVRQPGEEHASPPLQQRKEEPDNKSAPTFIPQSRASSTINDCVSVAYPKFRYISSELEFQWLSWPNGAAGHICEISALQRNMSRVWLQFATRAAAAHNFKLPPRTSALAIPGRAPMLYRPLLPVVPSDTERALLSRFSVGNVPVAQNAFIEPLSGIARHPLYRPRDCSGQLHSRGVSKMDLGYLVLTNHCDENGRPHPPCVPTMRRLFFDLGCSIYDAGQGHRSDLGSGSGPSLPLFYSMYEKRCIAFDALYGWEVAPHDGATWWRHVRRQQCMMTCALSCGVLTPVLGPQVPLVMRSKLHFINAPVEEPNAGATGDVSTDHRSFLALLNMTATPEDFVVLKVDIEGQFDGPELEIVQRIANTPALSRLVDELFFEYHFWFDGMDFGWGNISAAKQGTVEDALSLMRKLRRAGVRSHFWI